MRPAWFAAKAHGYGAGLPIAWQGWVVLAAAILVAVAIGLRLSGWRQAVALVLCIGLFVLVTWWTTEGGWRWR